MDAHDFPRFFRELHGQDPFPWQARLALQVCKDDRWPAVIDLPTGSGKTACIDIALFHLALRASEGRPQHAARRILFVVDRRVIVDEAADRAHRIAAALQNPGRDAPILAAAAGALKSLGGDSLLRVQSLRGGMPREQGLVRDPCEPAVVLSTVDQIGSRLLFRGYGVSEYARPMHAGLFAFDTLLLLDEAHIAEPFRQTLVGIVREQARASDPWREGPRPLACTQLSATPGKGADFYLTREDLADATLSKRLKASKLARLIEVADRKKLVQALTEQALTRWQTLGDGREQPRIGLVVNRVATARELFENLRLRLQGKADVELLIGRTRPLDRDRLMGKVKTRLKASVSARSGERPLFVVATQTIEVGADFDFHALYTEAASYPSLKQRFGRLNRLGQHTHTDAAIVFAKKDADSDPVYGTTLKDAWIYLNTTAIQKDGAPCVDLGISAAPPLVAELVPAAPPTPLLAPSMVELLAQTHPAPALEPDCAAYLHGYDDREAEVRVVWRSGLRMGEQIDLEFAQGILDVLPPLSIEALSLSRRALFTWLGNAGGKRQDDDTLNDFEGGKPLDDEVQADRPVLVQRQDRWMLESLNAVRPGEAIVVPTEQGGCDEYGFAPASTQVVEDLGEEARYRAQRRPVLVLTASRVQAWETLPSDDRKVLAGLLNQAMDDVEAESLSVREAGAAVLRGFCSSAAQLPEAVEITLSGLGDAPIITPLLSKGRIYGWSFQARKPRPEDFAEEDTALQRTVTVSLQSHSHGVSAFAKRFAHGVGLAAPLVADLELAGYLHDIGKADPRFQRLLGGDGETLLAKGEADGSRLSEPSVAARHECYSVSLVDQNPALVSGAHDPALVRHLLGSHHGRGRAWQPVMPDPGIAFRFALDRMELVHAGAADLAAVDSGWVDQFAMLNRRYGHWGLAYLETLLRLADHRRSESELNEAKEAP